MEVNQLIVKIALALEPKLIGFGQGNLPLAIAMEFAQLVVPLVVEECAKACEARIKNEEPPVVDVNGLEWDFSHEAPYNAEARACAEAIRGLLENK
jgi:hypothetical protein